jgi:hypothetical protein
MVIANVNWMKDCSTATKLREREGKEVDWAPSPSSLVVFEWVVTCETFEEHWSFLGHWWTLAPHQHGSNFSAYLSIWSSVVSLIMRVSCYSFENYRHARHIYTCWPCLDVGTRKRCQEREPCVRKQQGMVIISTSPEFGQSQRAIVYGYKAVRSSIREDKNLSYLHQKYIQKQLKSIEPRDALCQSQLY